MPTTVRLRGIPLVKPWEKNVNLRRNASTHASAIVEGSCSLFVGSNLLTPPPADQEMLPNSTSLIIMKTPTIKGLYSAARSSATPDAFRS
jgi:hypothetical protein